MNPTGQTTAIAWQGETRVFSTALEFESACVRAASAGALVLCATARFARRLLHGVRMTQRSAAGDGGWETPPIYSFRGWIYELYNGLWPPSRPINPVLSLRLWHEAASEVTAPEGLSIQPALYRQLQSSLEALLEKGLDPVERESDHPLAGFRREVTRRFLELAKKEAVALWSNIAGTVRQAVADGRVPLPAQVILAGFDELSPLETTLADALAARCRTILWRPSAEPDGGRSVRLFATPDQECRTVCADVLQAWNAGKKNLGIVFADRAYFSLLKRCFDELAGLVRPDFEKAIRYNLTVGTPLAEHPLFQTALLPLRALSEPDPVPLLTSLCVSPYLRAPGTDPCPLRDALWTPDHGLSLPEALRTLESRGFPISPFRKLSKRSSATLADWLTGMNACLAELGFCRFEGQHRATDALARKHLDEIRTALIREAGNVRTDAPGALAWLTAAAENVIVAEKTPETAGIQVLNLAESRGLAFDALWVVGAHGGVLPPPVREWPLLDPDEQRLMEGGTLERQWEEGLLQLAALGAAAPAVHFSRAVADGDESPYPPCPLIPDETGADGQPAQRTLNLWETASAEWMRARWLREGRRALISGGAKPGFPPEPALRPLARSEASERASAWSVTAIEELMACPFQFLCGRILRLEPLTLADTGIDPRVRGKVLHGIVKIFMDGPIPDWPNDSQAARQWLEKAVDRELARYPRNVFWRVERLRLLGDGSTPGILTTWLDQERRRALDGWRVVGTEAAFEGLTVAGITLKGRIDRIDRHPREGVIVWDYKSGEAPSAASVIFTATEIQLPAYLLALQRGLLPGLTLSKELLQAGYIALKKAAEVNVAPLASKGKPVAWAELLPEWETRLDQRLEGARRGRFEADPHPPSAAPFPRRGGACQFCEFFNLCGYFDTEAPAPDEEEEEKEF